MRGRRGWSRCAADVDKGVATARRLPQFQADVTQLEGRLENLRAVLPEEKDVADILRRVQGLATQSNLTIQRFTPQDPKQETMYASLPFKLKAEGTYHDLGVLLRSHQQVSANHQRRRHQHQGQAGRRQRRPRSRRSARPSPSSCRMGRPRAPAEAATSCRSSRQPNERTVPPRQSCPRCACCRDRALPEHRPVGAAAAGAAGRAAAPAPPAASTPAAGVRRDRRAGGHAGRTGIHLQPRRPTRPVHQPGRAGE